MKGKNGGGRRLQQSMVVDGEDGPPFRGDCSIEWHFGGV